jgi:hypothetical protein
MGGGRSAQGGGEKYTRGGGDHKGRGGGGVSSAHTKKEEGANKVTEGAFDLWFVIMCASGSIAVHVSVCVMSINSTVGIFVTCFS